MGTWGTGVLEDDAAQDVYSKYIDLYNLNYATSEIRGKIEEQYTDNFKYGCVEDNTPFWLGLAFAQWECGALDSDILQIVQDIVDDEIDSDYWEDEYPKRKKALSQFLRRITKPKATPRKRVKPRLFSVPFATGDCLAYRFENGNYGAAICLRANPGKQKTASALLAITRINQSPLPTIAQVKKSHLLIGEWYEIPKEARSLSPLVTNYNIYDLQSAHEASQLIKIGNLSIDRTFGYSLYPHHFAWNLELESTLQFAWEQTHPRSQHKKLFAVQDVVGAIDDEWGKFGECFARLMSDESDENAAKQDRESLKKLLKDLDPKSPHSAAIEFLARYCAISPEWADNWLGCQLRNF